MEFECVQLEEVLLVLLNCTKSVRENHEMSTHIELNKTSHMQLMVLSISSPMPLEVEAFLEDEQHLGEVKLQFYCTSTCDQDIN